MKEKTKKIISGTIIILIIFILIFVWYQLPIINPEDGSKVHGTIKFSTNEDTEDNQFYSITLTVNNFTVDMWSVNMDCICPHFLSYDTNNLHNGWHHFQVTRYYYLLEQPSFINSTYMLKVSNL